MTLTELRYIVAVAREKHFGRAADACYVSQPTLSVAIRKLEDQLGLQLFERSKTCIKVTPKGVSVIAQAQKVLEEAEKIRHIAEKSQDQLTGVFRLGTIYSVGSYLLPKLVRHCRSLAPNMPLMLDEDYSTQLRKKLRNGDLDAIIVALPFTEAEVNVIKVFREPFVALVPREHPLAKQECIALDEFAKENLLLLGQGHCLHDQVLEICPKTQQAETKETLSHSTIEGNSLEMIRQMVASGIGLSIFPISACQPEQMEQGLVVSRPLKGQQPKRTIALAYRQSYPRLKAIQTIANAIRQTSLFGIDYIDSRPEEFLSTYA